MDETIFKVGLMLSVEAYFKTHQTTQVLGWDKDVFLMTRAVYIKGQPSRLSGGDPCTIRFLKDGIAYGFVTEVIVVQFFPSPVMFLKFPKKVDCLKLRGAQRYKTDLPATFSEVACATGCDVVIYDISIGGCGLRMPLPEGMGVSPDGNYKVAFTVLGQEISIPCKVRKIDNRKEECLLGVEFVNMGPEQKEQLAQFIDILKPFFVG